MHCPNTSASTVKPAWLTSKSDTTKRRSTPDQHGSSSPAETDSQHRRERLIRLPEVLNLTGISRSSLYLKIDLGLFPKQIRLGPNMVAWHESAVLDWVANPR
ncbi:MAG: AlpA family phage regulatory protein [Sphingomonadaceae bacterium]